MESPVDLVRLGNGAYDQGPLRWPGERDSTSARILVIWASWSSGATMVMMTVCSSAGMKTG
jgi:hypothetical protein